MVSVFLFYPGSVPEVSAFSNDQARVSSIETLEKIKSELKYLTAKVSFKNITRDLRVGSSGEDVRTLQRFLGYFDGLYPEGLVTGYFGRATERAVKKFQMQNSIKSTGIVGPLTRAKINEAMQEIVANPDPLLVETVKNTAKPLESSRIFVDVSVRVAVLPKPVYDLTALGEKIQELINKIRVDNGLSRLASDSKVNKVALEHSTDQIKDNIVLTDPTSLCHYPLIRHEGFTVNGFSLGERYVNGGVDFKSGGENIAMVPASTDVFYIQPKGEKALVCPDVPKFGPGEGTPEARISLYKDVLDKSLLAVQSGKPANIINKRWESVDEIADKVVKGWMNSPGHRDNILRSEYNFSGMGVVDVNDYLIITHNFVYR